MNISTSMQNRAWLITALLAALGCGSLSAQNDVYVLADSVADFSSAQGEKGWSYGNFDGPFASADFTPMTQFLPVEGTHFSGMAWHGNQSAYWTLLSATGAHPNGTKANGKTSQLHWAVRRWTSPVTGQVNIAGEIAHFAESGWGNGAVIRILVDGAAIYSRVIENSDTTSRPYHLSATIQIGSAIDFVLDPRDGDVGADATKFTTAIRRPDPLIIADSVADFSSIQGLRNWEYGYSTAPFIAGLAYQTEDFMPMERWAPTSEVQLFGQAWHVHPTLYWTFINAEGVHPNGGLSFQERRRQLAEHWVIRRWASPVSGSVQLSGMLAHAAPSDLGNGVIACIHHRWPRNLPAHAGKRQQRRSALRGQNHRHARLRVDFVLDPRDSDMTAAATKSTAVITQRPEVPLAPDYSGWSGGLFSEEELALPDISGGAADPDGDGPPNTLDFGLGLSPQAPQRDFLQLHLSDPFRGRVTSTTNLQNGAPPVFLRLGAAAP